MKISIVIVFMICVFKGSSQDMQFSDLENLPEARTAISSSNNGEKIFVANGFGGIEIYTDEVYQYNISQNAWSTLTSNTIPKHFASAGIVGDFLYVFNGVTENGIFNNAVEKINLNDGSIQYLSENPQPSRAGGVATWDNKIYSFGGKLEDDEYSNKLYEFDPENDTWVEIAEIPFAGETKGEIVNGKLYVVGGYNGQESNQIDVYNLSANTWESNFEMPVSISAHSTALIGTKIYLIGDFDNLSSIVYFDTSDNSFEILTNDMTERRHCAAEVVGGELYILGGNTMSDVESVLSSVQKAEVLTSIKKLSNIKIMEVYPSPTTNILNLNMKLEKLYIYDTQGKEVRRMEDVENVEMTDLESGIYFLQGHLNQAIYQAKFIKK